MISIRPATRSDLVEFYGVAPPMTVKAWAAFNGAEKPVAVGGYYLADGIAVAFSDYSPELRKRDRVKGARALMGLLKGLKIEVLARSGPDGKTALKHFGFKPWGMFWRLG